MRLFHLFRYKKYLQRILLTVSCLLVLFVTCVSAAIYYSSEKSVYRIQQKSSEKLLTHINYNLVNLTSIMGNLSQAVSVDHNIINLLYGDMEQNKFAEMNGYTKLYNILSSFSFLKSIVVYNSRTDDFYSTSVNMQTDPHIYKPKLRQLFQELKQPVKGANLIPNTLERQDGRIDVLSYYWYDTVGAYRGQSAIMFNIDAEWLFANLKAVNGSTRHESEALLIIDSRGGVFSPDAKQVPGLVDAVRMAERGGDSSGFLIHASGGAKSIVTYMKTPVNDWTIVSVQPYRYVMGDLLALRAKMMLVTSVFLLLAIGGAFWATHRLYTPVQAMLNRLRRDALDEASPADGKDELSFVVDRYDTLSRHMQMVQREAYQRRDLMKEHELRKLVLNSSAFSSPEREAATGGMLRLDWQLRFVLILLTIDGFRKLDEALSGQNKKLLGFAVTNIAGELFGESFACETVDMQNNQFIVLLNLKPGQQHPLPDILERIGCVQEVVGRYYGLSLTAAVSDPIPDGRFITNAYETLQQYAAYKLIYGPGAVLTSDRVAANLANPAFCISPVLEKKLTESLKTANAAACESALAEIGEQIAGFSCDNVLRSVLQLVYAIKHTVKEMNEHRIQAITVEMQGLHTSILMEETLDDILAVLRRTCEEICHNARQAETDKYEMLVGVIKSMIEEQYTDVNLSLPGIAVAIKLSPNYVGRIFKHYEGLSVAEYINRFRLSKAREMLEREDLSINEIMERVGIVNQSYFYKLFKKQFGTTPKEYRLKRVIYE